MSNSEAHWDGSEGEMAGMDRRPISVLAIVALLTGLPAGLAFIIPGLGVLFVISVASALAAIYSNAKNPKSLVWLAYIGVFIATSGTIWSLTARSLYQNHIVSKGEEFAEQWVQLLVNDQIFEAICLRMDYDMRPLEGIDLAEYFQRTVAEADSGSTSMSPSQMKEGFLESRSVQLFLESGKETKFRRLPEKTRFMEAPAWFEVEVFFDVEFLLKDGFGSRRKSNIISVTARRLQHSGAAHWVISRSSNITSPDRAPVNVEGQGKGQGDEIDATIDNPGK